MVPTPHEREAQSGETSIHMPCAPTPHELESMVGVSVTQQVSSLSIESGTDLERQKECEPTVRSRPILTCYIPRGYDEHRRFVRSLFLSLRPLMTRGGLITMFSARKYRSTPKGANARLPCRSRLRTF